ncbi:MAG: hypothetical protein DMG00_27645 [Acidobacteria bacterium]|nr:MAG: hypothetical protein DMG00_27645 [Acidobacteriota bacterium]
MKSRILLVIPLLLTTGGHAAAQAGPAPPPSTPPASTVVGVDQNARETRDRLRDILGQYPPSLALVLQLVIWRRTRRWRVISRSIPRWRTIRRTSSAIKSDRAAFAGSTSRPAGASRRARRRCES